MKDNGPSLLAILGFIVGAYGALLSSLLGYLAWKRERNRVKLFYMLHMGDRIPRTLVIYVVNVGSRPVTLTQGFFDYGRGEGGFTPSTSDEDGLPKRLEEGEQFELKYPIEFI